LFTVKEIVRQEINTNLLPYQMGYGYNPNIIYERYFLPTQKV